jgi:hypothetical protein
LGLHSYDPGVSPTLGLWTIEIPDGSVEVGLHEGEAVLHLENVCRVFDAFTVPNSLNPLHPLGLVSAFLKSLHIEWKGITTKRSFNNGSTFRGDFVENSATIAVTVSTPETKPPFTPTAQNGFQFVANPASTVSNFAQIGHENNGALF